eukprot:TRINITY_DN8600_c0_g2_i1.p1 TRINITY_DN8600_c0_g2~~TRINITY_DN8600_c0_g2_i1.p1  ORF type:complete len:1180 (-),score=297.69 TRINITY_DN8600_c0_g2_i1:588-4097(-)
MAAAIVALAESIQKSTSVEDRKNVYFDLNSALREDDNKELLSSLEAHLQVFMTAILADVRSADPELQHGALRALGYFVHHPTICPHIPASRANDIIGAVAAGVATAANKTTANLCVWLLGVQNFPRATVVENGRRILEMLITAANNIFQSASIEHEAIAAAGKLMHQVGEDFASLAPLWVKVVVPKLFSATQRNRDKADEVMKAALPSLLPPSEDVTKFMYDETRTTSLDAMTRLLNEGQAAAAVRGWGYVIALLGTNLFKGSIVNPLLQIPEKTFTHSNAVVRTQSFAAWQLLIDNFSRRSARMNSKRVALVLKPLVSVMKKEELTVVRETCVQTWGTLVGAMFNIAEGALAQTIDDFLPLAMKDKDAQVKTAAVRIAYDAFLKYPQLFVEHWTSMVEIIPLTQFPMEKIEQFLQQWLRTTWREDDEAVANHFGAIVSILLDMNDVDVVTAGTRVLALLTQAHVNEATYVSAYTRFVEMLVAKIAVTNTITPANSDAFNPDFSVISELLVAPVRRALTEEQTPEAYVLDEMIRSNFEVLLMQSATVARQRDLVKQLSGTLSTSLLRDVKSGALHNNVRAVHLLTGVASMIAEKLYPVSNLLKIFTCILNAVTVLGVVHLPNTIFLGLSAFFSGLQSSQELADSLREISSSLAYWLAATPDAILAWSAIITVSKRTITTGFDDKWLRMFAPLLLPALQGSSGLIDSTLSFWESSFAKAKKLAYPSELLPVLKRLKARTSVTLPAWAEESESANSSQVLSENSEQSASMPVPTPSVPNAPPTTFQASSVSGSGTVGTPTSHKRPAPASATPASAKSQRSKKKLEYDGLDSNDDTGDYAAIEAPVKGRQPLTDKQRETRTHRAGVTTYSVLDGSQSMDAHDLTMDGQSQAALESAVAPVAPVVPVVPSPPQPQQPSISQQLESAATPQSPMRPILKSPTTASPAKRRSGGSVRFTEPVAEAKESETLTKLSVPVMSEIIHSNPQEDSPAAAVDFTEQFRDLVACPDPIDSVLTPPLRNNKGLRLLLAAQQVNTVGELVQLSQQTLKTLPLGGSDPSVTMARLLSEFQARRAISSPSKELTDSAQPPPPSSLRTPAAHPLLGLAAVKQETNSHKRPLEDDAEGLQPVKALRSLLDDGSLDALSVHDLLELADTTTALSATIHAQLKARMSQR